MEEEASSNDKLESKWMGKQRKERKQAKCRRSINRSGEESRRRQSQRDDPSNGGAAVVSWRVQL